MRHKQLIVHLLKKHNKEGPLRALQALASSS